MRESIYTNEQKQNNSTLFETLNSRQELSEHTQELVRNLFESCNEFPREMSFKEWSIKLKQYPKLLLRSKNEHLDFDNVRLYNKFITDIKAILKVVFKAENDIINFKYNNVLNLNDNIYELLNVIEVIIKNQHDLEHINTHLSLEIIDNCKRKKAHNLFFWLSECIKIYKSIKNNFNELERELFNQEQKNISLDQVKLNTVEAIGIINCLPIRLELASLELEKFNSLAAQSDFSDEQKSDVKAKIKELFEGLNNFINVTKELNQKL